MDNSGVYALAALSITTAVSAAAQAAVTGLGGISSANLECELLWGSGGTSVDVLAQTSFDGGTTWLDVAHFSFTTATARKYAVLNALASKGVTAYAALGSEGVNDGLLGDQLRAVITSVGTYVGTIANLRVHAK